MRSLIALSKFIAFFLLCAIFVPIQILVLAVSKSQASYALPYIWHKLVCAIFRLSVLVEGAPSRNKQIIYVSNHLSYLDIPVIGSVLKASFVAKKDVSRWPVFGFLSKLQQTAFIDRSRNAAVKEADSLDSMLTNGKSLILFPEGTSTDGRDVDPFKSSLFSLALKNNEKLLPIQPFSIILRSVNGESNIDNQAIRDIYAWHKEMDTPLPNHLWLFAKSKGAKIILKFHQPHESAQYPDRKALSISCYDAVRSGVLENQDKIAA
ncbi:MAG: lysophospholipid acyltransferase family protein [Alphaproteobacteria bacterium]